MRVLGVGHSLDLGDMYLRLIDRGHDVRVIVRDAEARDTLAGMVTLGGAWDDELAWVGRDGLVVYEAASDGAQQDALRADGYRVVGGSGLGDRLEQDRELGQELLRGAGLRTLPTHRFTSFDDAVGFIARTPRRYVLKFNGAGYASMRNYVGMRGDGADVAGVLAHQRDRWTFAETPDFILMDHVEGVEVGVGAYFDGARFLSPPNLDWEHKRLCNGDLGELTGEMGTVVTYRGAERLFEATLARLAPRLAAADHRGYVNLNTIIDDAGVWPLELTCRFGYPGFSILDALHAEAWDDILVRIADGRGGAIATHDGFAVGVVLTVPPFPYSEGYDRLSKGMPIHVPDTLSAVERHHLHFAEVARDRGQLVTAGTIGYVMVVTGRGATVEAAQREAYALAAQISIPNVRYRTDIGDRLIARDHARLIRLGWMA